MISEKPRKSFQQRFFVRHIAIPTEHGSWVFLFSPLLIGLFWGRNINLAGFYLILGAVAGFLVRQPITIAVKAYSGRRPKSDLSIARFWILFYSALEAISLAVLIHMGFGYVLILALPALPVLAWHLWLVSHRAERHQMGVEIVASGVLALAAPAAFWVGQGKSDLSGWGLWGLCWLQSAGSIVYAYLRLEQRRLSSAPTLADRLNMGRRALLYNTFNLVLVTFVSSSGWLPFWLPLAFAVQWIEVIWGTFRPAIGVKPTSIGIRQLIVSTLFTLIFILAL
jgi:hypothetical protein